MEQAVAAGAAARSIEPAISGMTCGACAARIGKVLNRLPGVTASVDFASEKARIRDVSEGPDVARRLAP